MKKILLSLVIMLGVGTAAAGATRAYFTSTVTVPNITLATGTLHVTNSSSDWMLPVTFSNIAPGEFIRKWVVIANDGTLDVGSLTVSATNVNDPSGLLDKMTGWTNAAVKVGGADSINQVQVGYDTNAHTLLNNASLMIPGHTVIHPGEWVTAQIQLQLPPSTGNEAQGQSGSFDLVFHAEQVH
jgi:hypothetical protein